MENPRSKYFNSPYLFSFKLIVNRNILENPTQILETLKIVHKIKETIYNF